VTLRRLVMVTRRFWPLVGGAERIMASLAAELASRHLDVTLLTARWQPQWSAELNYRGVSVIRLPNPPQRFWGTLAYMRALTQWLRANPDRYDLVYVSMLKHDAYAVLGAVGHRAPVVLRAEGGGRSGDCQWQQSANFGRWIRSRCQKADAIVAPSRAIETELIEAGYPPARVHLVPNGVPLPPPVDAARKAEARATLASASPLLQLAPASPLAVYTGRLDQAKGLDTLLAAWQRLVPHLPKARLWLAGEGPYHKTLEEQIEARGLRGRVVLAGVFDTVDELLAAADLFVLPSREEGMSLALLEALAAGVPVVASDIPGNRQLITHGQQGLLVPLDDVTALASRLLQVLKAPSQAAELAQAGRALVEQRFSLAAMADAHLALFDDLLRSR
jgi:glycosyltransferase involved in cell wall biosynthesis